MLQIIGLLVISWLLTWLFEKRNLSVLGLTPTKDRLKYFIILFIVSALISSATFAFRIYFAKEEYTINQGLTAQSVMLEIWYQIRTVLTEELLFRGAILYILIKRIGNTKGIVISSILFAMIHWINAGIWGNLTQMIMVFVYTFAMGLLLAYSYSKTFSLLLPFAIHFGWNLTQNYIFPDTATGNHIFILAEQPPTVVVSYFAFFAIFLLPKVSVLVIDFLIIRRHRQVEIP